MPGYHEADGGCDCGSAISEEIRFQRLRSTQPLLLRGISQRHLICAGIQRSVVHVERRVGCLYVLNIDLPRASVPAALVRHRLHIRSEQAGDDKHDKRNEGVENVEVKVSVLKSSNG